MERDGVYYILALFSVDWPLLNLARGVFLDLYLEPYFLLN